MMTRKTGTQPYVVLFAVVLSLSACAAARPENSREDDAAGVSLGLFSAQAQMPYVFAANDLSSLTGFLLRAELMNELANWKIRADGLSDPISLAMVPSSQQGHGHMFWYWGVNPPDSRSMQLVVTNDAATVDSATKTVQAIENYRLGLRERVVPYYLRRFQSGWKPSFHEGDILEVAVAITELQRDYLQQLAAVGPQQPRLAATRFDRLGNRPSAAIDTLISAPYQGTMSSPLDSLLGLVYTLPPEVWQAAAKQESAPR
jgi:hypothetical protein